MSCGQPHEVDCVAILDQVYEFLDGEASDEACATIRHHLEECSPCLRKFGLERSVKALVARSCGCDEASAELRIKVVTRIREVRVSMESIETIE